MASPFAGYEVEEELRPSARAFGFDLARSLSSVVALEAKVADDAFTAETLGLERLGNAVVISPEGLVLTIGYLVMEADEVVLTTGDGRRVPAHVLSVDPVTGFGLLHALEPLDLPALPIGDSTRLRPKDSVISAGGGGQAHALAGRVLARAPFSGYWEYQLESAFYVGPAHPHWSGAALINASGELVGVGSLRMEQRTDNGEVHPLNMFVPTEFLTPVLDDLTHGRMAQRPRPWIGVLSQEIDSQIVVLDVSTGGPAAEAGLRQGDVIRAVDGQRVSDLANFYGHLWALGPAGVTAPLTIQRGREVFEVDIRSIDRTSKLKKRRFN